MELEVAHLSGLFELLLLFRGWFDGEHAGELHSVDRSNVSFDRARDGLLGLRWQFLLRASHLHKGLGAKSEVMGTKITTIKKPLHFN